MTPINVAILTISDRSSRGARPDTSGSALVDEINSQSWHVSHTRICPDERDQISQILIDWSDETEVDVILTTGGTGFSPRDVTPEATIAVIDRQAPGIAEAMRAASLQITPHAMLSRSVAGMRGSKLIINLPGSPKGAVENLRVVIPVLAHAVELLKNDPHSEAGHRV